MRTARSLAVLVVLTACGASQTKPEYGPVGPDGCRYPNYPSLAPECAGAHAPAAPPDAPAVDAP